MKRKLIITLGLLGIIISIGACGNDGDKSTTEATTEETSSTGTDASSYDPNRGEGKFDEKSMLTGPIDASLATKGATISDTKCFSCHKATDERLVGPGWKGVTERRTPHWIMNFITNPDPMIDKDPELQAQLELCLVRMPNQNLNDDEARSVVEYMRENDAKK